MVFSDTPGIIDPAYKLHESMMQYVDEAIKDADVILFVTDIYEKIDSLKERKRILESTTVMVILNNSNS